MRLALLLRLKLPWHKKIFELSQKNVLTDNNIQCLEIVSEGASAIQLTKDKKCVIGKVEKEKGESDVCVWDSSTGQLLQSSAHFRR